MTVSEPPRPSFGSASPSRSRWPTWFFNCRNPGAPVLRPPLSSNPDVRSQQTYRVIQWATGNVGRIAIRHFVGNPTYDLVGVLVTNPKKVSKDAGEIAGIRSTG